MCSLDKCHSLEHFEHMASRPAVARLACETRRQGKCV